ncbi:Tropomyosin [Trichinella pseudospiralis]|uniref:Tropomyosin n=1 Tax=Trichinella pseudospiralis TaxID=6337 RepID=A0A0V1JML3_TRIPS|nr:Tropomyosin [Trichinella pseudospiralis]
MSDRAKEQLPDLVLTLRHRRIAVEEKIRQDKRNNNDLKEYERNKQKSYKNANVQNENVPFQSTRSRRSRFTNSCLISSNVFMRFRLIQNEVYNIYHIFYKQDSQQTSLLDMLKMKMRQAREEAENAKDEADEAKRKFEEEHKKREEAEAEVAALNRRIQLLEEDLTRAEERLKIATEKLEEASKAADESERVRKALENRFEIEDDRCTQLELKVRQMSSLLQETENKFEEVVYDRLFHCSLHNFFHTFVLVGHLLDVRLQFFFCSFVSLFLLALDVPRAVAFLNTVVIGGHWLARHAQTMRMNFASDLERAEERAEAGENKIVELEEELRVVGNNLKSLEVSEEKALQREDSYEEHIRQLSQRLKEAETRAEFAERSVQKLQKEVDRLEDDAANHRARNHALQEAILEAAAQ